MQNVLEISSDDVQELSKIGNDSIANALQNLQSSPVRIRTCLLNRFKADLIRFMKGNQQLRSLINITLRRL